MERGEGDDSITIRGTKVRGADVAPFGALWTFQHITGTKELAAARFFGNAIASPAITEAAAIKSAILEAIRNAGHALNQSELVSAAKTIVDTTFTKPTGKNKFLTVLAELERSREVVFVTGDRTAKLYRLP